MSQLNVNEAVKRWVRDCLNSEQPVVMLDTFLAQLECDGWPKKDVSAVCSAATRILVIIANPDADASR